METLKSLVINPVMLSFITTYKCTSACENCCFECNPKRNESLTDKDIIDYISKAVACYKSIKVVILTGGECFILGEKLVRIIEHATSLNLVTRIVTNGFWAENYEKAFEKVKMLATAGLKELNLSTGDDHLHFVPFSNIKNAALAALENNLKVVINIESAQHKEFDSNEFLADVKLKEYVLKGELILMNGIWVSFKNNEQERREINEKENIRKDRKFVTLQSARCENLFNTITIDPNHRMIACCGITSKRINYLDLGNTKNNSIKNLYENQFRDFLKIWLMVEGPASVMDFLSDYIENFHMNTNMHPCVICEKILNNAEYLKILRENYRKIYSRVMLKYFFTKKELENETAEQTLS